MDRFCGTRWHAQAHYCEASRHHCHEPRATRREGKACGNGLCADWLNATGVCGVLPVRDGKVGTRDQTGGLEGGIKWADRPLVAEELECFEEILSYTPIKNINLRW